MELITEYIFWFSLHKHERKRRPGIWQQAESAFSNPEEKEDTGIKGLEQQVLNKLIHFPNSKMYKGKCESPFDF